jgi:HAD superfamily hydrolase (TIGR01549 family)
MESNIKFVCFDWGGTLAYSGTRNIFLHSENINDKLSTLKNDTIETLKYLNNKNIGMGIITNTDKCIECMLKSLYNTGLSKYFKFVIFSNSHGSCKKPCNKIFESAMDKISMNYPNILPKNVMYVGNDYDKDVVGSKNIGMISAFLANNRMYQFAKKYGNQDIILKNISDIVHIL